VIEEHKKIREMFRPFAGLFHLAGFSDAIKPVDTKNTTLINFDLANIFGGMFKTLVAF